VTKCPLTTVERGVRDPNVNCSKFGGLRLDPLTPLQDGTLEIIPMPLSQSLGQLRHALAESASTQ
jgi:hypothetical protein